MAAVCAARVLVGLLVWILYCMMFLFLRCVFCSLVCLAAVGAVAFLVGLGVWIVCWRMFPILCCFLFPGLCGGCMCSGGSSGTGGVNCVLEDISNTMLFSLS